MKLLRMMPMIAGAAVALLLLSGCGAGTATETRVKIERVPVRAPCPEPETYRALKAERPKPLRDQKMPASAEERVARTSAQLGRFEAKGAWADKVEAALDSCQQGG